MVAVGIYCRISEDIEGKGLGVARQEADCRTLARLRGWDVSDVYVDNDLSAYKVRVVRPSFERLLADLTNGRLDGIVAYDLDRFSRQPIELERAISIYDKRPDLVFATVSSDVALSTSDGRAMARVLIAFANKSSMDTARRVKRKHLELAQRGALVGGNQPFGWQKDKVTIDPVAANMIRTAATDLINGQPLHGIVRQWNASGVTTPKGNPFVRTVVRQILTNPRLAGWRSYKGEVARDENGEMVRGQQESILDQDTFDALQVVLLDPERVSKSVHIGGRKYLLSGIIRCQCGAKMRGNANTKWNTFTYSCPARSSSPNSCGTVGASGPMMDTHISALIKAKLAEHVFVEPATEWTKEAELAKAQSMVAEFMDAYESGNLPGEVVFPRVSRLHKTIEQLRAERSEWLRQQTSYAAPTVAADDWDQMTMEGRRAIVARYIEGVTVMKAKKRGNTLDPERVVVLWR